MTTTLKPNKVIAGYFNPKPWLPAFEIRVETFKEAMQDVYDFFFDVNSALLLRGLPRLDDMLRPAAMSGIISDMLTARIAAHSQTLVENKYFNGHPDLIVKGIYANDAVKAGTEGIEVKTTRKSGGQVDMHGARKQTLCVFVYDVDLTTEPAAARRPMTFTEVYLGEVELSDFRKNERGELGTRTATLDAAGIKKLRARWLYLAPRGCGAC